jgi:hypothetical protein
MYGMDDGEYPMEMIKGCIEDLRTMQSGYPEGSRGWNTLQIVCKILKEMEMEPWVLGEAGASSKPDTGEILNMLSVLDSQSIYKVIKEAWMLYDEAVMNETGHLYNLGEGDPHWEGHL